MTLKPFYLVDFSWCSLSKKWVIKHYSIVLFEVKITIMVLPFLLKLKVGFTCELNYLRKNKN